MKRHQHLFVTLVFTIAIVLTQGMHGNAAEGQPISATVLVDNMNETVIEFETSDYSIESIRINGTRCSVISLPGAVMHKEKGMPEMPRINESIIIPDDAQMNYEIIECEYDTLYIDPVMPSKGDFLRSIDPNTVPYTFSEYYRRDEWWPINTIQLSEPFIIRDLRGITIQFNAFRHNASKGMLQVVKRLKLRVYQDGFGKVNIKTKPVREINAQFKNIYENMFINFQSRTSTVLNKATFDEISETGNMLIITSSGYDVTKLAEWKTRKGFKTEVVTLNTIGSTPEDIKDYIQDKYDNEGVTYVMLVGDAGNGSYVGGIWIPDPNTMPSLEVDIGDFAYEGYPADPLYVCLEGDDYYPDAFISRISDDVTTQINKILKYEMDPYVGSYLYKGCGIAYNTGDQTHLNSIRNKLLGYNYISVDQIYSGNMTTNISNSINSGRGIVNYTGHGLIDRWHYGDGTPIFSNDNVNTLTNTTKWPFIISVACMVGNFVNPDTVCFAEKWLRTGIKGAIGFYGSSTNQYFYTPLTAQAEVVDLLVSESMHTFGGLAFNGACKMIEEWGDDGIAMFEAWHIFGDASLQVLTNTPSQFSNVTITDNGSSVTVNTGISGSTICASSANNVDSYHQVANNTSSYTFTTSVRPLYITVTKPNYIPYQAVTGGTFTVNQTWYYKMNLAGNVAAGNGKTLTIKSGSTVNLNGYCVDTQGTGVIVRESGVIVNPDKICIKSGSTLKGLYSTIQSAVNYGDANQAVQVSYGTYNENITMKSNISVSSVSSPKPTINGTVNFSYVSNTALHNFTVNGTITFQEADADMSNINSNASTAVYLNNSDAYIVNLYTTGGSDGIKCYNSDIYVYGTVIEDFYRALYYPSYGYVGLYDFDFCQNSWDIYKYTYSSIYVGEGNQFSDYPPNVCYGMNEWEYPYYYTICPYSKAASGDALQPTTESDADVSPLGIATNEAYDRGMNSQHEIDKQRTAAIQADTEWNARNFAEKYTQTIVLLRQALSESLDSHRAWAALSKIASSYWQLGQPEELYQYLNTLRGNPEYATLRPVIDNQLISYHLRQGDPSSALEVGKSLLATSLDDRDRASLLYRMGNIYLDLVNEPAQAAVYYQQVIKNYPEDPTFELAQAKLEEMDEAISGETDGVITVTELSLSSYPNPFNPTATVSFSLPEDGEVSLIVYDMLGREVVRLVEGMRDAGRHELSWDGRDSKGQQVPTGVYVTKLTTPLETKVIKMLMVK